MTRPPHMSEEDYAAALKLMNELDGDTLAQIDSLTTPTPHAAAAAVAQEQQILQLLQNETDPEVITRLVAWKKSRYLQLSDEQRRLYDDWNRQPLSDKFAEAWDDQPTIGQTAVGVWVICTVVLTVVALLSYATDHSFFMWAGVAGAALTAFLAVGTFVKTWPRRQLR